MSLQGSETDKDDKLAELDKHQTSHPVMVSVVSSISIGGNFIFLLRLFEPLIFHFVEKSQKCQICVIYENLD